MSAMGASHTDRTNARPADAADEILEGLIAEFLRASREAGVGEAAAGLLVKFARRAARNPDSSYTLTLASSRFGEEGVRLFERLGFKIKFIGAPEELCDCDEEADTSVSPARKLFVIPEETMLEIRRLSQTCDILCD